MRIWSSLLCVALASASVPFVTATVQAEEKDEKVVDIAKIPDAARKTLVKEADGSPILKVEEEKQKDRTLYEAHVQKGKDVLGIRVDAAGKLIDKHLEKNEKK